MFLFSSKLVYKKFSIAKLGFLFSPTLGITGTLFFAYFQSFYISFLAYFLSFFLVEIISLNLKGGIIDVMGFKVFGKSRKKLFFDYLCYRISYMGIIIVTILAQLIIHTMLGFPIYIYPIAFVIYLIVTMPLVISYKRKPIGSHIMQSSVLLLYILLLFKTTATKDIIQTHLNTINHTILVFLVVLIFLSFLSFKWFCRILDKKPFVSQEIKKKLERWN